MKFAIETTCLVPISRRHVYEAETLEQALVMAVADIDWEDAEGGLYINDDNRAPRTFVTGLDH
jgi:hypothetical protein